MSDSTVISAKMRKNFDNIRAHYDLSDDFFGLFQDPSRIYSEMQGRRAACRCDTMLAAAEGCKIAFKSI